MMRRCELCYRCSMKAVEVRLPNARRVLDFGCGTAWLLAGAEQNVDCRQIGIDCDFASLKAGKEQYPKISFVAGDGLRLPFASECFDVVIGHVSMPYMNTTKALREIWRVMTPGGSLFLTFHSFACLRERFCNSLRRGNWKDVIFCIYMAVNGVLNRLSLPQTQAWWKRERFETVNMPIGVAKTARKVGFSMTCSEYEPSRIFFAFTARKPDSDGSKVLPEPAWSAYCSLALSEAENAERSVPRARAAAAR
jgi:ubiquinone/menaquinone biosynthesis C-methylase UbiE